jgi:hypothetical protein
MSRSILIVSLAVLFVTAPGRRGVSAAEALEHPSAWERASAATQAGDWAAAIAAYREHLAQKPQDAWSWYALGLLLHSQSDFAAAAGAFESALEHRVTVPSVAQYNLACSLARQGRHERAAEVLEEALAGGFHSGDQVLEDPDLVSLGDSERRRLARVADEAHRPCLHQPEHAQFDFWLGEWEVTIPSGFLASRDEVTRSEDGCVVHQSWKGTLGNTGRSYSFYDAAQEQWVQAWVGSAGLGGTMTGGLEGDRMVLVGASSTPPGSLARTSWLPQPDASVQVLTENSTDGGVTWTEGPVLTYRPARH